MSRRIEKINHLLREEVSELLSRHVKDPRLNVFLSVTRVVTSPDLHFAKVYISIMGTEEEKTKAFEALNTAAGFLRRELRPRLTLHRIPDLSFHRDDSIEEGSHILELINQVVSHDSGEDSAEKDPEN